MLFDRMMTRRGSAGAAANRFAGLLLAAAAALLQPGAARADFEADYKAGQTSMNQGDMVTAIARLRGPADAGHAPSQALLAYILDKSELDAEAVAYYRKAVALGNADAQYDLGVLHAAGEGVAKDEAEARRLIGLAAAQGHPAAVHALAQAYLTGGLGVDAAGKESPAALDAVQKAAANNWLPALDALAAAYTTGRWGLLPNPEKAAHYKQQADSLRKTPDSGKRKGRRP
jgi:hypothetical protein